MPLQQIVCLANSRKRQGRCVAGLRADGAGWLRPIGRGADGALTPGEHRLPNGTEPRPLDVIELELSEPRPDAHQPENWLLGRRRWRLVSRPAPKSLAPMLRTFLLSDSNLFGDRADRMDEAALARRPVAASLALVSPEILYFRTARYPSDGRWHARAHFTLGGVAYDLGLTDPACELPLSMLPLGEHEPEVAGFAQHSRLVLTVSLGDPFHGHCYKLVAAVIAIPDSW